MAIQSAIKFIRESQENRELRKTINQSPPKEIFDKLAGMGYEFTMEEFEEAVNMLHVKCQFEEEANRLMQTKLWFTIQF
ncbi:Nif11-like leader peptide family natural product precursor [Gaoshiqia sediminis]|uniref:Nif11-like leader peptide family natural product n=1 Tax=Gaoshiqia sediminis TaxID=2986998 RepID=A0AA42C8M7_9BACT|nr:Nif11-like leader peptide family natural product precursor [Gaoshiqia sediminis]MCW0482896.1 Nif11-like leader peptide family natural product precursor [Gaoshiqia sediminis]